MYDKYLGLTPEHFQTMMTRYKLFQDTLNDVTTTPAKVFNPLSANNLRELELIREASKELQSKKEDDMKKAARAAAERAAEEKKEVKEEVEVKEEKTEDAKEG